MGQEQVTRPIRLQLSRAKGFNLQALSQAMNGLSAVKVDRSTKWGNPFVPGRVSPYGSKITSKRHAWQLYLGFAPLNEKLVEEARAELRGKNLACWCQQDNPYEDACHAAVLLRIANSDERPADPTTRHAE